MRHYVLLGLLFCSLSASSQEMLEESAVISVVENLFEGMRQGDSAMVSTSFVKDAEMHTIFKDKDGNPVLRKGSLPRFLTAVGTPHEQIWDEPIWDIEVRIDGNLAQVWAEYAFYLGKQFSHCGVDAFQLFKDGDGWKIFKITDTRKKEGCEVPDHIKEARK